MKTIAVAMASTTAASADVIADRKPVMYTVIFEVEVFPKNPNYVGVIFPGTSMQKVHMGSYPMRSWTFGLLREKLIKHKLHKYIGSGSVLFYEEDGMDIPDADGLKTCSVGAYRRENLSSLPEDAKEEQAVKDDNAVSDAVSEAALDSADVIADRKEVMENSSGDDITSRATRALGDSKKWWFQVEVYPNNPRYVGVLLPGAELYQVPMGSHPQRSWTFGLLREKLIGPKYIGRGEIVDGMKGWWYWCLFHDDHRVICDGDSLKTCSFYARHYYEDVKKEATVKGDSAVPDAVSESALESTAAESKVTLLIKTDAVEMTVKTGDKVETSSVPVNETVGDLRTILAEKLKAEVAKLRLNHKGVPLALTTQLTSLVDCTLSVVCPKYVTRERQAINRCKAGRTAKSTHHTMAVKNALSKFSKEMADGFDRVKATQLELATGTSELKELEGMTAVARRNFWMVRARMCQSHANVIKEEIDAEKNKQKMAMMDPDVAARAIQNGKDFAWAQKEARDEKKKQKEEEKQRKQVEKSEMKQPKRGRGKKRPAASAYPQPAAKQGRLF